MKKNVSEAQKNNWIMEAEGKNASLLIILYDPFDDDIFPFYCLPENKEKENNLRLANTIIEEIPIPIFKTKNPIA